MSARAQQTDTRAPKRRQPPSGTVLVVVGVAVVVAFTAVQLVFGPGLRRQVLEQRSPRTLRQPIAEGEAGGYAWEAIGRFDGDRDCVTVRFAGRVSPPACQGADVAVAVQSAALHRLGADLPTVVYGAVATPAERVRVTLDGRPPIETDPSGSQFGFAVDLYAVAVPPGASVQQVVALDAEDGVLGAAEPPV
jgi:hypothetical protein